MNLTSTVQVSLVVGEDVGIEVDSTGLGDGAKDVGLEVDSTGLGDGANDGGPEGGTTGPIGAAVTGAVGETVGTTKLLSVS
jgi:hypothetical protein